MGQLPTFGQEADSLDIDQRNQTASGIGLLEREPPHPMWENELTLSTSTARNAVPRSLQQYNVSLWHAGSSLLDRSRGLKEPNRQSKIHHFRRLITELEFLCSIK